MDILTLIIKNKFFDEIIAGTKLQEFREIRPNLVKKYCKVDDEGYAIFDEEKGIFEPRHYDAIRFYVGYGKNRASALVSVTGCNIELFVDENNEFITYEHNGETCLAAQVVYDLGPVLDKENV